ncbi:tRNA wybutosine-synthesizing protein 2 homolog isoform X3 [Sphaerodactylus townsendi]|uniref:tRNA wybutosine-synthesizing protein 2 homolog isoform X3 n=1 Tax=Sphaerodactylus townsendi TaxID=933632 RepID=UPI002026A20A|nr:tRNA wybutosine-synthesizing protein 2 homolog isoform X3 [Sphaerodactylus townsendi]
MDGLGAVSDKMDAEKLNFHGTAALITKPQHTQLLREYLEREGILNSHFRVQKLPNGDMALPVLSQRFQEHHLQHLKEGILPGRTCALMWIQNPIPSKSAQVRSPIQKLHEELESLVLSCGAAWSKELEKDLPRSWQQLGDLVLLNEDSFRATLWGEIGPELWEMVAGALGAKRLARHGRVQSDSFRSPTVTLLLGKDGWVEQMDNGIWYRFDVTRCMLSAGNITEKLRIASLHCAGEVVVDLYAGIGYFTLPYLVHAGAAFVHACEWNPHAVEALQQNLQLNGVHHRCRIHQGDNRKEPSRGSLVLLRWMRTTQQARLALERAGTARCGRQSESGTDPIVRGKLACCLPCLAEGFGRDPSYSPECGVLSGEGPSARAGSPVASTNKSRGPRGQ